MTERIWTFRNGELLPREGELLLDDAQPLTSEKDLLGPMYVENGLLRSDTIIFLGYCGLVEEPEEVYSQGYLVSRVDTHSTGGLLVAGELVLNTPRDWVNRRITNMWAALHDAGYTLEDFGLPELDTYIRTVA